MSDDSSSSSEPSHASKASTASKAKSIQALKMESKSSKSAGSPEEEEEEIFFDQQAAEVIDKLTKLHPNGAPEMFDKHYVLVSLFVTKMENFESAAETVFLEFSLVMWWRDKELIGKTGDDFDPKKLWNPEIDIVGTFKIKAIPEGDKGTYWILEQFSPHGIVSFFTKYRTTLHVPLELRSFPFDQQIINLRITSRSWGANNVTFVNFCTEEALEDMLVNMDMQDWENLTPLSVYEEKPFMSEDRRNYSQICLEIQLKRKTGYYLKNIIFLVMLISIMEWAVFFLDPLALDSRLSIGVTLFLAAVAFNFVIAEEIPRVSHSTHVSKYFLVTYTSLMLSIVENVIAFILANNASTDSAKILDWVFLAAYGAVVVTYSVVLVIIGTLKGKKIPHQFPPEKRLHTRATKHTNVGNLLFDAATLN
jgi:hypothetical protein